MTTAQELAIGQEVILHDVNERPGYPPTKGTIVKIGRVRVTIQEGPGWQSRQYRIDDQSLVSDRHPGAWFRTVEQEALEGRRAADLGTLRDHGLHTGHPRPSDDLVHQIAEFLRAQL